MKIGINLVGVSYNNGTGRHRNYRDAITEFYKYIVNPLINQGHEIFFFVYSYENEKMNDIIKEYTPLVQATFIDPQFNNRGGGEKTVNGMKVLAVNYMNSLKVIESHDYLDVIISTRFDIKFHKNPFEEYNFDFDKLNFLWREPEFMEYPIINDNFLVFPHKMTQKIIDSILLHETNPPRGLNLALHNLYLCSLETIGKENVQWVDDTFHTAKTNTLYTLTRHE